MISEITILGIDVSRDWLDGFCLPSPKRFRRPNTLDGHGALVAMIQQLSGPAKVGLEATIGQEWVLWTELVDAGTIAVQLGIVAEVGFRTRCPFPQLRSGHAFDLGFAESVEAVHE